MEVISLHRYIRNIYLQTQKILQKPAENLTTGKEYIEPGNTQQDKEGGQKKRRVSRTGSASGVGN